LFGLTPFTAMRMNRQAPREIVHYVPGAVRDEGVEALEDPQRRDIQVGGNTRPLEEERQIVAEWRVGYDGKAPPARGDGCRGTYPPRSDCLDTRNRLSTRRPIS
jgi:hypothetical protein